MGFGPKSLVNAGRLYDGVHLHTFMGETALANAVAQVRQGEEEAGRTPGQVKVWSVFATVCDASEEAYLKRIVARLATYLQIPGYGDALVAVNGWDPEVLARFRGSSEVRAVGGLIDSVATGGGGSWLPLTGFFRTNGGPGRSAMPGPVRSGG